MKKRLIIALLLMLAILAGCSRDSSLELVSVNDVSQDPFQNIGGDRTFKLLDENQDSLNEDAKKQPDMSSASQPGPNNNARLDVSVLDKLDNTKYAWGLLLNTRHETPGIPSYAAKLTKEYGAVFTGDTSQKVVYLTFDEGYENGYTSEILDTLKKDNVKALFFITGPYLKTEKSLVKRMLDEGHQVGDHTIDHPSLPAMDYEKLEYELYGLEQQFSETFGKGFKYMRPPMGEYSERVLEAARQLGYKTVFWSFAYEDYDITKQKGADNAYKVVMDHLHNGAVILLHAVSKDNAEALDRIIKGIRAEGYEIRPFDL